MTEAKAQKENKRFDVGAIITDAREAELKTHTGEVIDSFEGPLYSPGWRYRLRTPDGFEWTAGENEVRQPTPEEMTSHQIKLDVVKAQPRLRRVPPSA